LDLDGFFDPLWNQFQKGVDEAFIKPEFLDLWYPARDVDAPAPLSRILRPARLRTEVDRRRRPRPPRHPGRRSRMRSRAGRLTSGVVVLILVAWLHVEAASGAAIRGAILNAGPLPERKQIPINIDQYVCGKGKESEDLVVGSNRGIRS